MLRDYFKRPQRFKYDRERYSSEENENGDDDYLFSDISISTVTKIKTSAEISNPIFFLPIPVLFRYGSTYWYFTKTRKSDRLASNFVYNLRSYYLPHCFHGFM